MGKFMNFFENLFNGESEIFSRQDLSDCIFGVFEKSLKQQTTREGLLFDTNYIVYLQDEIYDNQQDSFAHTAREVVNRCHNLLRKIAPSYPAYKPHSRCWKFRFIKVTEDVDLGRNNKKLKNEHIVIVSSLHVEKRKAPLGKRNSEACVKTVMTTKKTVEERKIDYIDLDGLTVLDKDSFEIKLDKFEKVVEMPVSDFDRTDTDYIAHAIIKLKNCNFTDDSEFFYMTKESLYIVGTKYDTSNFTSKNEVAVIEDEKLSEDFFINLEALKDSKFTICGNGDILLNEDIHLTPDKPKPIQDGSSIMFSNGTQIIFSIIK
ncbi:hypothetical protein [Ileibacterium valens]|uniref:hypothetical protein n=1 Tax=Ileibacterium valens TaxID=1862668 RepID=UPI00322096D0